MESSTGPSGRQRAQTACTYCRRRKMRCNNEQPRCMNCRAFDQECVYTQSAKKKRAPAARQRTSDTHVTQLEEENQNLRMRLAQNSSTSSDQSRKSSFSNTPSVRHHERSLSDNATHSLSTRSSSSAGDDDWRTTVADVSDANSAYIGLTSASVLEDASGMSSGLQQSATGPISRSFFCDTEQARRGLEQEAAEQRRQEAANYYARNLDFDGVDPDLGMHLLSGHWNRQHHSYLITYRPAFMRDMACQGPHFSKLLLNAIYFSASKFSSRESEVRTNPADVRTAGAAFRQRTKELLVPALEKSEITTIQALLLMARSLFALGEGKSVAWTYAGIAFHMIIDLGMHMEQSSTEAKPLSDEDLEIRRRVFWAAFVIDKLQSLCQGRPLTLHWRDCRVPLFFLDQYEEHELWQPLDYPGSRHYPQTPTYSVSAFHNLCRLCIIMDEVLSTIYAKRRQEQGLQKLGEDIRALQRKLDKWFDQLDSHLKFNPSDTSHIVPPPSVLSLLCIYHVLIIQLHYPLTIRIHQSSTPEEDVKDSFTLCSKAAKQIVLILMAYHRTFSILKAPYLIAYATYVSATIHVRDAARRPTAPETMVYLRNCLSLMDENQETNPGIENAKSSLTNLMRRLSVTASAHHLSPTERNDTQSSIHSRTSSAEALNTAWTASPIAANENTHVGRTSEADPMANSLADIDPIVEDEAIFQEFAGHHPEMSFMNQAMPSQFHGPGMTVPFGLGEQNSLESMLLDPVGVDFRPTNMVPVEQLDLATSDFNWGDPMT